MKELALFGASGHGKVVADAALAAGWQKVVFFDDAWPRIQENGPWAVVGNMSSLIHRLAEFDGILVAIGNCPVRWRKHQELAAANAPLTCIVHPRACVSPYAHVGGGTVVMPGAIVNIDAIVGEACIINTGATVDHDCFLAGGVHISPGANLSGNVTIGAGSWVGVGATVRQGVRIGAGVTVGAGAVVVRNIEDGQTVVGNPAMPLNRRS